MKTITREDLIKNAQCYNKHLTDEYCETLTNRELAARCHPFMREDYERQQRRY